MIEDRYEETGKRFDGGMGAVLQCRDTVLDRMVAIKIMSNADRRRVKDELNALFKMRSKHVVQVYDLFKFDHKNVAIVQEYIDGQDLFEKSSCENTSEYLKIIWQIACGIADIHDSKIIHRDIKPNNMKIDSEGILKIFDFGLARNEGPSASTMGFVGTPGFAAPELYSEHVTFTEAIDVYAFGATALYLAIQGIPSELRKQPPKPVERNYFFETSFELSEQLAAILARTLNTDPSSRPSMREICDVLSQHLLQGRHRALVVYEGNATYLDLNKRSVTLQLGTKEIKISYNGFHFYVEYVKGEVYINNRKVTLNEILPGACVVALGAPSEQNARKYITFDLSHPEIIV